MFFFVLVAFGIVWFLVWWKSYHIKVKIYEPFGQVKLTRDDYIKIREELKEGKINALEKKNIKFESIKYTRTHGKFMTKKGTSYFALVRPLKKLEPIPLELLFDDGVHLLRISKNILIPIPKPKTFIGVGENVSLAVTDINKWQSWNNQMADRINNKYQDIDAQKKIMVYFIIGIVAMVVIGGFILWLIYSSINKGISAADTLSNIADKFQGNAPV